LVGRDFFVAMSLFGFGFMDPISWDMALLVSGDCGLVDSIVIDGSDVRTSVVDMVWTTWKGGLVVGVT
jgi:hypothetical protein